MTGVQTCALRSEEHTSELQSHDNLVCRLLLEKKENQALRRSAPASLGPAPVSPHPQPRPPRRRGQRNELARRLAGGEAHGPLAFFFTDRPPQKIFALSLRDALPI